MCFNPLKSLFGLRLLLCHLRGSCRLAPVFVFFQVETTQYLIVTTYVCIALLWSLDKQLCLSVFLLCTRKLDEMSSNTIPVPNSPFCSIFITYNVIVQSFDSSSPVAECSYQHLPFTNMKIATQLILFFFYFSILHFPPVDLKLQLSVRDILPPRGLLTMSRDIFGGHTWEGLLVSSRQRPGMLLDILQCTGRPPRT